MQRANLGELRETTERFERFRMRFGVVVVRRLRCLLARKTLRLAFAALRKSGRGGEGQCKQEGDESHECTDVTGRRLYEGVAPANFELSSP